MAQSAAVLALIATVQNSIAPKDEKDHKQYEALGRTHAKFVGDPTLSSGGYRRKGGPEGSR